jgi:uncharacterized membrane protein
LLLLTRQLQSPSPATQVKLSPETAEFAKNDFQPTAENAVKTIQVSAQSTQKLSESQLVSQSETVTWQPVLKSTEKTLENLSPWPDHKETVASEEPTSFPTQPPKQPLPPQNDDFDQNSVPLGPPHSPMVIDEIGLPPVPPVPKASSEFSPPTPTRQDQTMEPLWKTPWLASPAQVTPTVSSPPPIPELPKIPEPSIIQEPPKVLASPSDQPSQIPELPLTDNLAPIFPPDQTPPGQDKVWSASEVAALKNSLASYPLPDAEKSSDTEQSNDASAESAAEPVPADTHIIPADQVSQTALPPWLSPPPDNADETVPSGWLRQKISAAYSWLIAEGNIWVTSGVVLFLVGFTLLFKYAYDTGYITLEMCLATCAAVGLAMSAFGWKMRSTKRTFALMLQGGGIGLLYLVILGSNKMVNVLPTSVAALSMLFLSVINAILAVKQNFQPLAIVAILAGYATPILLSTDFNNFVVLFSIYSLMNLEVLVLSFFRDWSLTRWTGLSASAGVGLIWGLLRWDPQYLPSVEPFIILFFFNYLAVAFIPMIQRSIAARFSLDFINPAPKADSVMLALLPFVFLVIQLSVCSSTRYGAALSCLGLGLVYLFSGALVSRSQEARALGYQPAMLLVFALSFSNLTIPFIFQQASSTAIWALEGSFLLAYAIAFEKGSRSTGLVAAGLSLQAAALILYYLGPELHLPGGWALANQTKLLDFRSPRSPLALTGFLFSLSAFISVWFLKVMAKAGHTFPETNSLWQLLPSDPEKVAWLFSIYGTIWWLISSWHVGLPSRPTKLLVSAFAILTLGGAAGLLLASLPIWRKKEPHDPEPNKNSWNPFLILTIPPIILSLTYALGLAIFKLFLKTRSLTFWLAIRDLDRSFLLNWVVMAVMFAMAVFHLGRIKANQLLQVSWSLLLFSFTIYTGRLAQSFVKGFEIGSWLFFLPILALAIALNVQKLVVSLRLQTYYKPSIYTLWTLLFTYITTFFYFSASRAIPSVFWSLPVLNAIDCLQICFIAALYLGLRISDNPKVIRASTRYLIPGLTFLWLNSLALRIAWRFFGEYVTLAGWNHFPYFNGSLAVVWSVAAFLLIYSGQRLKSRSHWLMGSALLALNFFKLFFVDLRNAATIIRITAFLLMGLLCLLIGWLAPLPPKRSDLKNNDPEETGPDTEPSSL